MRNLRLLFTLLLAGCAGTSMTGTVDGKQMSATNAITGVFYAYEGFNPTIILVSDVPQACQAVKDNKNVKSTQGLIIILGKKTGTDRVAAGEKGTYTVTPPTSVPDGNFATVIAFKQDATCTDTLEESKSTAVKGTVTLEDFAAGGSASGKFNVEFPGGDTVQGEFDASFCNASVPSGTASCG